MANVGRRQPVIQPVKPSVQRYTSSARLPCADGAPPYAAASILVNDCGASLPPTEIITGALIDPILTRWSASERLPRAENQCAVRLQLISGLVRIADSRQTSREVRKVPMNEPASAGGAGGAVGRLRLPE
jgi:hypothetical protein